MKAFACSFLLTVFLLLLIGASNDQKRPSQATLKKSGEIDLTGQPGKRFDYLTIDYDHGYLLSAHLGANKLYVIDLNSRQLLKTIEDTPGAEGVEYVAEFNKVYTSNWGDHTVGVIDMNKMEVVKKIPVKSKPDGNVYAPGFGKLYVSDERAKTLFVIDVRRDEVTKTLLFESETGMPQYDPVTKKIYLNLQDENAFVVIDPVNDSVIGKYPVEMGKGNHGMALDAKHHRAFLACEGNNKLVVLNLDTYKSVAALTIPPGCDVVKFDPGLSRIYVACYEGKIAVIREVDPDHYSKLEDFPVEKKVHSLAVDEKTHKVYVPEQEENGKPAAKIVIYDAVY